VECHRDRPDLFPRDADKAALAALAHRLAGHLGPIISGRYIPHRYAIQAMEIQKRNAAVHSAFTGANHAELMRRFGISRRLVYSILAQRRKQ